jgi:hypothetical protein
MEPQEAQAWLAGAQHLRRRTRATAARYWFPLVVFGAITLGATPLYTESPASGFVAESYVGGFFVNRAQRLSLYWLLGMVAGYLATVAYVRWRAGRSGLTVRIRPFVISGLAMFAILILVSPAGLSLVGLPAGWTPWIRVGDLFIRGLTPVLTIAIALLVLAAFERSVVFAAYCLGFLGVALAVNLYDVGNVTYRMGLGQHGLQANVVTAGLALLLGGLGFGVAAWTGRAR